VIQVAKISKNGEILFNKASSPSKVKEILANTKPCIVAMEGCGSFHYWGRLAISYGHQVRGMSPNKVKPFITNQKTDSNDAIGIAVAATQLGMMFSPVKNIEQHTLQSINTSRKFLDKITTSLGNNIRALLYEFGFTIKQGKKHLREVIPEYLSMGDDSLPSALKQVLATLWQQYIETEKNLKEITEQLNCIVKKSEPCQRLMALEGVAEKGAAGLFACLGDGSSFKNGRSASVYVGVTPKQHSSGGKIKMVGINKAGGDVRLRATLYTGTLAVISHLPIEPKTQKQQWLIDLVRRVGVKRACIALVNKTIRTAWAMLRYSSSYKPVMV
jgi:transposase